MIAGILIAFGTVRNELVVGLVLTTTALGMVLPILRDAGLLSSPISEHVMAAGTVGEFGPILAMAILLDRRNPIRTAGLLLLFVVVAVGAAVFAARPQPPRLLVLLHRHVHSSAQLPVRISILFILGLVYLAFDLGLDVLLGAFAAGIVVRLIVQGDDEPVVRGKLEAIGFGFLVPIFFIVSGMQIDLHALTANPTGVLAYRSSSPFSSSFAGLPHSSSTGGFSQEENCPSRPAVGHRASPGRGDHHHRCLEGRMLPVNAAALVAASVLSVLIYPASRECASSGLPEHAVRVGFGGTSRRAGWRG